jgi:hypothetical protein
MYIHEVLGHQRPCSTSVAANWRMAEVASWHTATGRSPGGRGRRRGERLQSDECNEEGMQWAVTVLNTVVVSQTLLPCSPSSLALAPLSCRTLRDPAPFPTELADRSASSLLKDYQSPTTDPKSYHVTELYFLTSSFTFPHQFSVSIATTSIVLPSLVVAPLTKLGCMSTVSRTSAFPHFTAP